MGCDIHAHVEVKIGGKWEHYSTPVVDRCYTLFTALAGVRRQLGVDQLFRVRGLPSDGVSIVTSLDLEYWKHDGHTYSWVNGSEAERACEYVRAMLGKSYYSPFGYLLHNGLDLEDNEAVRDLGVTDVRVVFWFDN